MTSVGFGVLDAWLGITLVCPIVGVAGFAAGVEQPEVMSTARMITTSVICLANILFKGCGSPLWRNSAYFRIKMIPLSSTR